MSSNKYQNALNKINANIDPDIAQKGSIGSFTADKNDIYGKCLETFNKNVEPDVTASEHVTSRFYESAYIEGRWPVVLEDSAIKNVGDNAFYERSSLTSVSFPACTSIGEEGFAYCESLTSIYFPACESIGENAFDFCESLSTANFSACETIGDYAFEGCTSLTSVSFPVCTNIGDYAFYSCSSLTSANFHACMSIGAYAFASCTSLTSLYFTGSSVPSIASNTFSRTGLPSTATFYVASSMVDAFKSASYWSAFASQIVAYTE